MMRMLVASMRTGIKMLDNPKVLSIIQCATSKPQRPNQFAAV